jgi:hypothetical protein
MRVQPVAQGDQPVAVLRDLGLRGLLRVHPRPPDNALI